MSRMRKTYPPEFKAEAVRLVREDGMGVARVAASLGVNRTLVRDWVRRAEEAALAGTPAAATRSPGEPSPAGQPRASCRETLTRRYSARTVNRAQGPCKHCWNGNLQLQ